MVLETNIDDMSPQHYELAMERLFAAGAHDVWMTPIVMKKGRPAITLSALAAPADEGAVARVMLTETTTIGVRVRTERRHVLERAAGSVDTPYGAVREPGRYATVNATAEDQVIEGVEDARYRFCLGVQWHPEYFIDPGDRRIFEALIVASRA